MYKKYPRQMLRSRCVSEGVRTVYPAATSGMYVPEEVQDFDEPRPIKDVTPRQRSTSPHDPQTGEIREELFQAGPTVDDLIEQGEKAAEGGETTSFKPWWEGLSPQQRVSLGAGRGTPGERAKVWIARAREIDRQRQAPADDQPEASAASVPHADEPQAEPLLPPVGEAQTDDEVCTNILNQVLACRTLDEVDRIRETWKPRMDKLPIDKWTKLAADIGKHETQLFRAAQPAAAK
jgi:hypothetical protein